MQMRARLKGSPSSLSPATVLRQAHRACGQLGGRTRGNSTAARIVARASARSVSLSIESTYARQLWAASTSAAKIAASLRPHCVANARGSASRRRAPTSSAAAA